MESQSESEPETVHSWTRWMIAAAIGLGGSAVEIFSDNLTLLAAPQVCAAAIAMRLPTRQFLGLVVLLSFAVFLPALIVPPNGGLLARGIGFICLVVVALVRLGEREASSANEFASSAEHMRTTVAGEADDQWDDASSGSSSSVSGEAQNDEEPSTLIHTEKNADALLPATSTDLVHDLAESARDVTTDVIKRLKSTGSFNRGQIQLIETELKLLAIGSVTTNDVTSLENGDRVGRFVIDEPLGRGGVGNVYRGHDLESGEPAAIKILHNVRVSDRFRREMEMVQQLAHPNIVTAYEAGVFQGLPFITMELLRGPDLNVHVREDGPLDWLTSSRYILQTARALEHSHRRNLIHRDIKPGNIILNGDDLVKLADLGLAAVATDVSGERRESHGDTKEGHLAGTLPYMAPEQAKSLSSADVRSDIYSLGATWFYLLTGKPRLRGDTFSKQFENLLVKRRFNALPEDCLPDSLRKIYRKMTAYDARRRYESCCELSIELEQALETAGESVTPGDINVLVVEDSHTDMLLTIEMLRRTNQSLVIHQAKSLAEGIETFGSRSIDLVLLDLTLPDSSGVQTVQRFREAAPEVPIVVLTGLSEEEIAAPCIEAGATNFVSKSGLTAHKMERTIFITLSRYGMTRPI